MGSDFKVIVVGGGPVGLAAAHALHLAGIEFIILERRAAIVEDKGASIVVHPHTLRIMSQFGLLDALQAVGGELRHHRSFTVDGHIFKEGTRYQRMKEGHGHGPVVFHRAELVEIMYNGLPPAAREKILTSKKLVDIETNDSGVVVKCDDGSTYPGSMVMGADGVHSTTRRLMRDIALKENPSRTWDPVNPYTATYQLLFGAFPLPSDSGLGYDIQARDKCIMYLSGPKRGWIFLYKRLPQPTSERTVYTDEDVETLAAEFAEFPLTQSVKVKDVWETRHGAGLTNLEEGIVNHWSLGRIVLVGDACHKFTTHVGLGLNNGIQDIVALCNILRGANPTTAEKSLNYSSLRKVFEAYETLRKSSSSSLHADLLNSGLETRMHAWANPAYYLISRWLMIPNFAEDLLMKFGILPQFRKGLVLDYVPGEEPMRGQLSWLHPMSMKA